MATEYPKFLIRPLSVPIMYIHRFLVYKSGDTGYLGASPAIVTRVGCMDLRCVIGGAGTDGSASAVSTSTAFVWDPLFDPLVRVWMDSDA